MKLAWTRLAIQDLNSAYDYIVEENASAAAEVIERIENSLAMLLRHPHLGRIGRVSGTRELVISGTPLIAAYRPQKDKIEVLAVIHTARRWPDVI